MSPLLLVAGLSRAADVDLGVGVRSAQPGSDAAPVGVQVTTRVALTGNLAVEANGFARFPLDPVSNRDRTLLAIAYEGDAETTYSIPIDAEVFAGELLFEASPWARTRSKRVTVWGYAAVGATLRAVQRNVLEVRERVTDENDPSVLTPVGTELRPGPVAGLGFDAWFGERVGLRALARGRLGFRASDDLYGDAGGVDASVAVSYEVLVGF